MKREMNTTAEFSGSFTMNPDLFLELFSLWNDDSPWILEQMFNFNYFWV